MKSLGLMQEESSKKSKISFGGQASFRHFLAFFQITTGPGQNILFGHALSTVQLHEENFVRVRVRITP